MTAPICRRGGFTLLEVMLVVLLLGILMSIAIPNWLRAHETSARRSCVCNLRQIEQAKERLAMEERRPNGSVVEWSDIIPAYVKQRPECPVGGIYSIDVVGRAPKCSARGHDLP